MRFFFPPLSHSMVLCPLTVAWSISPLSRSATEIGFSFPSLLARSICSRVTGILASSLISSYCISRMMSQVMR